LSDDFDALFDSPASPPAAPTTSAPAAAPAAEPAPAATIAPSAAPSTAPAAAALPVVAKAPFLDPPTLWMPLLKPGTEVRFQDKPYTVGHVLISKGDLFVNLKEIEGAIPAEKIRVRLTQIDLKLPLKLGNSR
jgi:hypothetical protein